MKTQTQHARSKANRYSVHQKEKTDGFVGKSKGDKKEKLPITKVLRISSNKNRTI